jgi:hypothetical protein
VPIIYCEADYGYGNCDSCGYSGHVNVNVYDSIHGLLAHEEIKRQLHMEGWVNLREIKDIKDKAVLESRFYLLVKTQNGQQYLRELDITNLSSTDIAALSYQSELVQRVDLKSVLTPEQYKQVNQSRKYIAKREKDSAAAKQKRAEKALHRKLEKAKRLLAQHEHKDEHIEMMGT